MRAFTITIAFDVGFIVAFTVISIAVHSKLCA